MLNKDALPSLSHLQAYPPWPDDFPVALAEAGRDVLLRPIGLDLVNYGTARMMWARADAQRDIVAFVPLPWDSVRERLLIEVLPQSLESAFRNSFRFASPVAASSAAVRDTLAIACDYLSLLPGLAEAVGSLTKILHVLVSQHDDYDTSHSDPALPFSVFVSVPEEHRPVNPLRVVESLIHETMHLQLSLLERLVPLIDRTGPEARSYSPWRGSVRDAGGVLHALYVFRVIERFWVRVLSARLDATSVDYAASRREQIVSEISEVSDFRHCPALTLAGKELVERLLDES